METLYYFLALLFGYLFGSISISRIVTHIAAPNVDLTKIKMHDRGTDEDYHLTNVGATTASMVLGPKIGGLIGILDILKAFLPTLAIRLIFPDQPYYLFTGGGVVGGHIWTAYHKFRGGGGISPALGAFLAIDPIGTLATNLIAMILGFFVFREYLVAMTLGTWLMIPWLWISKGHWGFALFAFLVNLMLVIAIIPDVSRYIRARASGKVDVESSMEAIPMGRMMNKMMARMGLSKKAKKVPNQPSETEIPKQ